MIFICFKAIQLQKLPHYTHFLLPYLSVTMHFIHYQCGTISFTGYYHKWGKIRWAKLSRFSWFLRVLQKISHEFFAIGK